MSNVSAADNSALADYSIDKKKPVEGPNNNDLGRDEFLELMIAQMNNQNPLEPSENGEFIAQLAQFSTVEGIENLNGGFEELANSYKSSQAVEASTLVGSAVTLEGTELADLVYGDIIFGTADIPPGMDDMHLQIYDEQGVMVEELALGYQNPGEAGFKWDGVNVEFNGELLDIDIDKFDRDENGNLIPHGNGEYQFKIVGTSPIEGTAQELGVSMSARVDSVSIQSDNSVILNLQGGGTATLNEVRKINQVI